MNQGTRFCILGIVLFWQQQLNTNVIREMMLIRHKQKDRNKNQVSSVTHASINLLGLTDNYSRSQHLHLTDTLHKCKVFEGKGCIIQTEFQEYMYSPLSSMPHCLPLTAEKKAGLGCEPFLGSHSYLYHARWGPHTRRALTNLSSVHMSGAGKNPPIHIDIDAA